MRLAAVIKNAKTQLFISPELRDSCHNKSTHMNQSLPEGRRHLPTSLQPNLSILFKRQHSRPRWQGSREKPGCLLLLRHNRMPSGPPRPSAGWKQSDFGPGRRKESEQKVLGEVRTTKISAPRLQGEAFASKKFSTSTHPNLPTNPQPKPR